MATYDPQKGRVRPKPAEDAPAPVDELLDVATEAEPSAGSPDVSTPEPAAPRAPAAPTSTPAPAPAAPPPRGGPAKKVGVGVAITAVLFALRWALKRKKGRSASS